MGWGILGFGRHLDLGVTVETRALFEFGGPDWDGDHNWLLFGFEVPSGLGTLTSYLVFAAACLLLRAPGTGAIAAPWDSHQVLLLGERG